MRLEPWAIGFAAFHMLVAGFLFYTEVTDADIGAVCGEGCGGATLAGVPLSLLGLLSMAVVAALAAAVWKRATPALKVAAAVAALAHAGASWGFAGEQWVGAAKMCVFCQVAAVLSAGTAALLAPGLGAVRRMGIAWGVGAPIVGVAVALVTFPMLEGAAPEAEVIRHVIDVEPPAANEGLGHTNPTAIEGALRAASLGSDDAPYEMVVLTDFACPICRRFEQNTLPTLIKEAVDTGQLRIQFLFAAKGIEKGRTKIIAATASAMAGVPFDETLKRLHPVTLQSVPQGVHLFSDIIAPEQGLEQVGRIVREGGWDTVVALHARQAREVSVKYFKGRSGTPAFVLYERKNPKREPYVFYGYQRPGPFLEYMNLKEGE